MSAVATASRTEGPSATVRLTPVIEQTVHRLLAQWALRVLRTQTAMQAEPAPKRGQRRD